MRKNSVKLTRINQEIVRELSELIRSEVKDPRVGMMTSVTGADTTTDLKSCKVYISVLGGEEELKKTMEGLKACKGFLRRMLAQNLNLRNTPELIFVADRSIEYGTHIAGILDEMHRNGTFSSDDEYENEDAAGADAGEGFEDFEEASEEEGFEEASEDEGFDEVPEELEGIFEDEE